MRTKLFLFFTILSIATYSQEVKFINYKLKDMGYISIPDNLEVQSGNYKKFAENLQLSIGTITYEVLENRIVFQQKGLNQGGGKDTYARVIIKTYIGEKGDYALLNSDTKLSTAELNEIASEFKKITFSGDLIKLITWYGVENVKLNNKYNGIKTSYLRQAGSKPYVYVELYQINNNNKMHEISLSYRQNDENLWKPLFEKIIKSIIINH